MRFTENEMTQAMAGAAKSVLATRKDVRKQKLDVDDVWEQMSRYERFQVLDALGDQVLPVLVALPDVEVEPGTRPTFTDEQVRETVEAGVGDVGRLQRAVLVRTRIALVNAALAAIPPRQDPDALIVPDHL
ncbi:hypothetical protein NOK12_08540 [Nocardioides sp. OK12]|uniref:Uncharacterized protein n=1 Tax=Nocardioides marinisabuli TaxID=419476 RepID=A0A7Y9F0E1_9ACTN|nr:MULTISPECIES: hypothetical protein [Nocardioides]NYD57229.1 hypothetical protein [Nocardioides marinisabuli]GHJ58335.1 hypothetical protein NOK12_08540 [Nocardioides sp. OK12]